MIAMDFPAAAPRALAAQLWPIAAMMLALAVIAAAALTVDGRMLDAAPVWAKPLKFAASLALYFATLALVADRLSPEVRAGWGISLCVTVAVVAAVAEMAYILFMAGRGERSHFNTSAPLYETLYMLMGIGAVSLMLVVAAVGIIAWRDTGAAFGPGLRLGILAGFVGATVLTLVTAGALGGNGGHFVGVPRDGAPVLPLLGWSAAVGDLRPAHFLALHAMQALPLLGLAVDALGWALWIVPAGGTAYAALTVAVFAQALRGLPLIRL